MPSENTHPDVACINWRALVVLFIFLLLVYSNTFNASWHLDDFSNITQNARLQIDNLYPQNIYKAAFEHTDGGKVFYRPVTYLSFALNWYFGKTDVTGYHVVNITVHILTAFFLYISVLALFKTPKLADKYSGSEYFIALLAAVLWAANPIQTQAVTYIVQRMAAMAAMFYVLSLYLYIKARISVSWKSRVMLYAGVLLSFMLAVGSKENAFMLPGTLFLVEVIFFQNFSDLKTRKRFICFGCALAAAMFGLAALLFMDSGLISGLQGKYESRTFSLYERLLTEPRIIVFYLTQIFYPIADRLSIVHDIEVSKSLFQPWKTLPAILFILGLTVTAFCQITRRPLLSFALLFFLLNHVIESTLIPLELIFEHRNYLPSLFLFVPVAAGLKWGMDHYAKKKQAMAVLMTCFVTVLVMLFGIGTYVRNMAWANERTLWQDALEKAPGRARPYYNLAAGHYSDIGDYNTIIKLCKKAMNLQNDTRDKAKVLCLENIANAYAKRDQDYDRVIQTYEEVLSINPDRLKSHYHMVLALIQTGQLNKALKNISDLISKKPGDPNLLTTRALIYLQKDEAENAITDLIKAVKMDPDNVKTLLSLGSAKLMAGNYEAAAHYLHRIKKGSVQQTTAMLLLIENSVKSGNLRAAEKYAERLVRKVNPEIIHEKLEAANYPGYIWPISIDLVAPVIAKELKQQSNRFSDLTRTNETKARS